MKKFILFSTTVLFFIFYLNDIQLVASDSIDDTDYKITKTPFTADFIVSTPTEVIPPRESEGGGDKETGISGLFGIAYVPNSFDFQAQLAENGEQRIDLRNSIVEKYNVGIQDKTRKKHQNWMLRASLKWDDDANVMSSTSIQASECTVKENIDGNLHSLSNEEVFTKENTLTINATETEIMQSNVEKVMNGVYNYQIKNPQLVIPNVSEVAPGSYNGKIIWNLVNTISDSEDSIVEEAIKKVNNLFNGNELNKDVTQQTIDDALNLVNQVTDQAVKQELLEKINKAQNLLDQKPIIQTLQTTNKPNNTLNADIRMGNGHDRQDLGFQLEKDSLIKIKQTNPNFKEKLTLRLLTNDSETESSIDFSKDEVELTAKELCVPFIDTPYNQSNGAKPTIEIVIKGKKRNLPRYNKDIDYSSFSNLWNSTQGYALIQGKRFQIFLPEEDKDTALMTNLSQVINMYDNDIIGFYNKLIGLSDHPSDPLNQSSNRRYFYKADKHGAGGLYYGRNWAAESSSSAADWLSDGWGVLHETGHGYQGSFMNTGMSVGEVWNNLYGVIYLYQKLGKAEADRNTWLYNYGHKSELEANLNKIINSSNPQFNNQDARNKLIVLSNIIDKAGNEGLQYFYTKYREYANHNDFNPSNYPLADLLVSDLGASKKYDFSAVLTAWGLAVSDKAKKVAKENDYQPVAHLAQVVPDEKLEDAISQLTQNYRLSSVLSLVTNKELDKLHLYSNVTLNFQGYQFFKNNMLRILKDNQLFKEISLTQDTVTIENMPNGVYTLELDTDSGYITNPYLFVKEKQTNKIDLVDYANEATQAVQNLYQDKELKFLKTTFMEKDIDKVYQLVKALPSSNNKENLLNQLEKAYNQLQELTFQGLGDRIFATMDVINSVATIRTYSGKPHVYFSNTYASIVISRHGKNIYGQSYKGDCNYSSNIDSIPLQEGDIVNIMHSEAETRFIVNHSYLKNNNENYKYIVENGLLKLIS